MDRTTKRLLIGEVARAAGVNLQTVLFYERQGLIPKAGRRPSGYREFDPQTVDLIGFIQHAQELGFTLKEIVELLALRDNEGAECSDVQARATQKLRAIQKKIQQLDAMRTALDQLVRTCSGQGSIRECAIIEALQEVTNTRWRQRISANQRRMKK